MCQYVRDSAPRDLDQFYVVFISNPEQKVRDRTGLDTFTSDLDSNHLSICKISACDEVFECSRNSPHTTAIVQRHESENHRCIVFFCESISQFPLLMMIYRYLHRSLSGNRRLELRRRISSSSGITMWFPSISPFPPRQSQAVKNISSLPAQV